MKIYKRNSRGQTVSEHKSVAPFPDSFYLSLLSSKIFVLRYVWGFFLFLFSCVCSSGTCIKVSKQVC